MRLPEDLDFSQGSSSRNTSSGVVLESIERDTRIRVSKLYIAIADKMKSTDSGRFDDAINVLQGLPVAGAEDAMRGLLEREPDREMLLVFDKNGALVDATLGETKQKGESKATAPVPEGTDLNDTVVTHTHPDGSPLSKGDVLVAIDRNLLEIRATGRNGTFVMRRKDAQWGPDPDSLKKAVATAYATSGQRRWQMAAGSYVNIKKKEKASEYRPILGVQAPKRGSTFEEDLCMVEHFACTALAVKYGWTYTHPDEVGFAKMRLLLYEKREASGSDKREGFGSDTTPGKSPSGANEV